MSKRVFFLFLSDLLTSACTLLLLLVLICSVLRCLRLLFLRLLLLLLRLHVFFCTFLRGVALTHTPDARRSGGGDSRLCFLVYNCADRSGLPETRAGIRTRFWSGRIHPSGLVCLFSPVTSSAAFLRKIAARCTTASLVAFLGTLVRGTSRRGTLGDRRKQQFLTRLAEEVTSLKVGVLSVKRLLMPRSTSEAAPRKFSS